MAESEKIIEDVDSFYSFTQALAANSGATSSYFPQEISPEEANELIENTFNYYFARQNPAMVDDIYDSLTVTFALEDEKIKIGEVALSFNDLRSSLKDFLTSQTDEPEFTLADAEIAVDGNNAVLTLVGTFGQHPMPSGLTVFGFGANDKWSIWSQGGKYGTTAYDNLYGSPEILTNAINRDITQPGLSYMVNITTHTWIYPSPIYSYFLPSTFSAPDNPLYLYNSNYWGNLLMHYELFGTGNTDPEEQWIDNTTMNYYRTWTPIVASAYITQFSTKTVRSVKIVSDYINTGAPLMRMIHGFANIIAGDIVSSPLPSNAIPL